MAKKRGLTLDATAAYQISVQGYLDPSWSDRMCGVSIQVHSRSNEAPVTILTGQFQDQAALAGVLGTLYDLGLPLLSVECLAVDKPLQAVAASDAPKDLAIDQVAHGGR